MGHRIFRLCFMVSAIWGLNMLYAQAPMPPKSAAEIQHALGKLQVLVSALYVAAHPDDENTRLITYLAKGKGYRTAYLSLTRGDGGQNLIGDEKGTLLGMLRTQELLAARRLDGGEQMFSRAYDFGYSKNPEEALSIWDKEKVLGDVVWAIRKFRPDVIITRFPGPEKGGGGHGHHTASAMLAQEAFGLANDPNAYPEQLAYVQPWQPKRLVWNTWHPMRDPNYDMSHTLKVEIGGYDPLLGRNYGEIAGEARSMHKCQAFGASRWRGSMTEYLQHELGEEAKTSLFEGIDTNWSRVPGAEAIGQLIQKIYTEFQPLHPEKSVPALIETYQALGKMKGYWPHQKRKEIQELILYCAGIWLEANAEKPIVARGDSIKITAQVLKRNELPVELVSIQMGEGGPTISPNQALETNAKIRDFPFVLATDHMADGQPYWLRAPQSQGLFKVSNQTLIGLPQNPAPVHAQFVLQIHGEQIAFETPVIHKYVDRAIGELYRPFLVAPPVTANLDESVYLFASNQSQRITVRFKANTKDRSAAVSFKVPKGWRVSPRNFNFVPATIGEERLVELEIFPPAEQREGTLSIHIQVDELVYSASQRSIAYDHIPTQMVFSPTEARLVRVSLEKRGDKIGYIMGSGDEIPACLSQIGYQVDLLSDNDITPANLKQYDAVIAGIRAYNTNQRMPFHQEKILEYVEQGGTYLVQYNTAYSISTRQPGPYPLRISRDRVSVEEAKATLLKPEHPAFHFPNTITEADFEGWVQERGLYFPNQWDDRYEALISWHDPGEDPKLGGLLVAKHGKGYFVYSGISWFRELPAGVPGAYRLFANLLSLGKEDK